MVLATVSAWAQPTQLIVLDDETLACEGKVRLKFTAGIDEAFDDYVTYAQLYVNDGAGERELLYIVNTDLESCTQSTIDMSFESWCYNNRSSDQASYGTVESITSQREGDTYFFIVTIGNLRRRTENDLNFRLRWSWDGDTDFSNQDTRKTVNKKSTINAIFTSAFRDDCNPNEVRITANANVACNKVGFKYRMTIQKSTNANFSSPTTLVDRRSFESANAGSSIVVTETDTTSAQVFYKSIIEYIYSVTRLVYNPNTFQFTPVTEELVYQRVESIVTPVQQFSVAPPALAEVSKDICNNRIKLKWQYNAAEANSFNIYRASGSDTYLQFDGNGDYIEVLNSTNISPATTGAMTIEALVRVDKIGASQTIIQNGAFSLYIENGVLKGYVGDTRLRTLTGDALPLNSWVHVALSASWNDFFQVNSLYVNGKKVDGVVYFNFFTSLSVPSFSQTVKIGIPDPYPNPAGFLEFQGGINNVRIWNTAYTSINPNRVVSGTESDLVMFFDFEEGVPNANNSGISQVRDRSANQFVGQLNGFALQGTNSNFGATFVNHQKIASVDGKTLEYEDNQNIVFNQPYEYYITAVKTCGGNTNESLPSNSLSGFSPTTPIAPTGLTTVANRTDNTIRLNWKDNAFDETAYEIRRRFGDASTVFIIQPNDTTYVDNAVVNCRRYEYDVFAKNVCGVSNTSAQGSARLEPNLEAVLAADQFKGSKGAFMNRVELTWTAQGNTKVDRYRVYRKVLGTIDSVQIDVVSGNTNLYRDQTSDAGVLYEYTLVGEVDCDGGVLRSNVVSTVGYRSATALVSGQVTYKGGNAVERVKVLVAPADGTQVGKSLSLDGVNDKVVFDSINWMNQSFTIEFWAKRSNANAATIFAQGNSTIADNENLNIGFNASGNFVFGFGNNDLTTTPTYHTTDWQHWTCVYDATANKRYIYKNDSLVLSDTPSAAYAGKGKYQLGATLQNTNFFAGQLDELRIWSIAKDSATVARDYNRILNGNEANIFATYSLDEGVGYGVYDRSKTGLINNQRHGQVMGATNLNAAWSMNIPTPDQLSLYGLTDANGNYIIASIPYTGVGQTFKVLPQLGIHRFEPSQRNLFIGERSDIFNGTDFTDISSFPVTGTVFYKGTSCPADQIEIQIDGVTATLNGNKVMTNSNGTFTVDVPIGRHRISLFKAGHQFEVGQFPTDGSLFDFQEPLSGLEFIDITTLKVIGRVVGGTREGNKVPGLGRSVNNIGRARIVYEALVGGGCHRDTVFTNNMTGEYVTQLYPLKYVVKDVRVVNPMQNISTSDFFEALPQIDLVNVFEERTAKDSVFTAGTNTIERIDSVKYNYRQDFVYRKTAELTVLNEDRVNPFIGEKEFLFNSTKLDLTNANMRYPVFKRFGQYKAYISAFEQYQNFDAGAPIQTDKVPVTDGKLVINNQIARPTEEVIEINLTDGDTIYSFITGRPEIVVNNNRPEFSYTQTLDVTLKRPGQVEDVKWEPNSGIALEDRVFRAYVIGFDDIVGSNFVSQGPDVVKFVLRDPPGNNSKATFTKQTEIGWTETASAGFEQSFQVAAKIGTGVKTTIGVGTETDIEATSKTNTNIQIDYGITAKGELSQTWTSSESYSTNDANEAVGTRSDLYVGETYNVIFGVTNNLEFIPNEVCEMVDLGCREIHPSLPFKIGVRKGFTMSPSDTKTTFIYDQNYILNYLIPNLKTLRNNLFISNPQKYVSKLLPSDDNYGKNNDDRVWGMAITDQNNAKKKAILDSLKLVYGSNVNNIPEIQLAKTYINNPFTTERSDSTGMSYTWKPINSTDFENGKPVYGIGTDSVRFYNQAIRLWEEAIRDNEKDKIQAINGASQYRTRNISLNGGTAFANEESYSSGNSVGLSIEFSVAKNFASTIKADVGGTGVETELEQSNTFKLEVEVTRSSQTTTTWAYEIKDVDQGDFHNIEVYKSPAGWGPIFRTIAGQTSCPHEDGNVTLFYEPGTKLNERTLQRDKVGIDIFPKVVQNVPEGEAAVFNVQFKNLSEANDARIYAVRVDPNSNPDGLGVSMDGRTIAVENSFAMSGSSVLTKVIKVERGPEKYEYNDIRLLFYVPCQYQAGTSDEVDIVDTVTFSVSFLPECTNIRLKEPTDLWVLNNFNRDTLPITIDNYDINKNGFESISLQYRPASEATWRELNKWWHPTNKANEMGDKIPLNSSFIRYDWDMSSNVDGPYHLRVVSGCALASKETEFKKGIADRINPTPFGTPSPGDGICDPGEDLKIRFNEMVDIGSLTSLNFDIRGVLNGTPLRNSESVAFDGSNDYIEIPAFDLTRRSFAIEFWAKRNAIGVGTVFSQGSSAGQGLFVGFDATNHFQFSFAGQTLTSTETIPTGEWKHFVASFDFDSKTAKLFIDGVEKKVSNSFTEPYVSTGAIKVGQTQADGSKSFNGNLYELRLWSRSRSSSDIVPNLNISLIPTTSGLMGYWQMNEGFGTLVEDKVRKRNGVLSGATWAISPVGRAFNFNGSSNYLEVTNGGLLNFSEETSMTIELWFKGTAAGTLLSNGKGDGSDTKTSWTFGLDANGKIVVRNNGETFESNTSGYLDNNWHHLSIVLERNAAINLYLDGQLQKTGNSNIWKGFAGSKLWIGVRGWFSGSVEMRDQYFSGSLDDIRLWNLARRPEQIQRDWVNRLSGNELGLVAYYPFEAYRLDAGVPVLDVSLADQSMNSFNLTRGGSTGLNYAQPTPPIKLQRPIQKVNFNYIVNGDEIILTPTDPSSRLEHVTLDITVKGVKDIHGNIMQSPATWIAFMNKNQVNWDRSDIELTQVFGQTGAFEAIIVNSGGSAKAFQILNLPSWLSASPSSGTIAPNSQLIVKFTISNTVNIGKYEQDLFLSTDFGFNERLTLNLKVKAVPPTWVINPSQFQHTMSYVGQLQIENIISTDTEDQLAVFVNNQLRGVANVVLDNISNKYLVFLDVFSNVVEGEKLEFRIWDASEGKVRVPVNPTNQTFTLHEFIGTRINPQIFSASNSIEQAYSLNNGWNWISFPLNSSVLTDVNETLDGLTPVENDRILSQQYFDTYTTNGWAGSLSSTGNGFNRKELYKVYLTNSGTFTYNGRFDAPANDPITIGTGWNWIGFISQKNMEINTALASLSPSNGDVIKGQRTFAVYETGLGWGGSLTYLEPTQGYMLRMANTGTLIYPAPSSLTTPNETLVKASNQLVVLEEQLNLKPSMHGESMSIVGAIADCEQFSLKEHTYLAAFVGEECRGIAPIVRSGKSWRTYLTIHGRAEENIHFQLLTGNKSSMVKMKNQIVFEAEQLLGMPSAPYLFEADIHCNTQLAVASVAEDNISDISVYPNPFDSKILIDLNLAQAEKVTIRLQDVNGRTVGVIYSGELSAGRQQISWNADSKAALSAGIYFLHIQADSMHRIEKIVKTRQ
jgi:hypothetical protein